jgi:toxin-antitoxin system PIN domain toxin
MATLCDTNVWLALALSEHKHHALARDWLDSVDERSDVYFCRATQQSFVRLPTTRAVLGAYGSQPLTNAQAWDAYSQFWPTTG